MLTLLKTSTGRLTVLPSSDRSVKAFAEDGIARLDGFAFAVVVDARKMRAVEIEQVDVDPIADEFEGARGVVDLGFLWQAIEDRFADSVEGVLPRECLCAFAVGTEHRARREIIGSHKNGRMRQMLQLIIGLSVLTEHVEEVIEGELNFVETIFCAERNEIFDVFLSCAAVMLRNEAMHVARLLFIFENAIGFDELDLESAVEGTGGGVFVEKALLAVCKDDGFPILLFAEPDFVIFDGAAAFSLLVDQRVDEIAGIEEACFGLPLVDVKGQVVHGDGLHFDADRR